MSQSDNWSVILAAIGATENDLRATQWSTVVLLARYYGALLREQQSITGAAHSALQTKIEAVRLLLEAQAAQLSNFSRLDLDTGSFDYPVIVWIKRYEDDDPSVSPRNPKKTYHIVEYPIPLG